MKRVEWSARPDESVWEDPGVDRTEARELVDAVEHWHQAWRLPYGIRTPGSYDPEQLFKRLRLPDIRGRRILDVGTADGFFAFKCESLGAEVVAIDHKGHNVTGFETAKRILGSNVEYVVANVYDLDPKEFGRFDIVLCLGVVYHLRHPLLALDRLRAMVEPGGALAVESLVCDEHLYTAREQYSSLRELAPKLSGIPIAQFLPAYRYSDDATNKWSPNLEGLKAMVEDAGFAAERVEAWDDRGFVWARAVESAELDRLRAMDAGFRDVP